MRIIEIAIEMQQKADSRRREERSVPPVQRMGFLHGGRLTKARTVRRPTGIILKEVREALEGRSGAADYARLHRPAAMKGVAVFAGPPFREQAARAGAARFRNSRILET